MGPTPRGIFSLPSPGHHSPEPPVAEQIQPGQLQSRQEHTRDDLCVRRRSQTLASERNWQSSTGKQTSSSVEERRQGPRSPRSKTPLLHDPIRPEGVRPNSHPLSQGGSG